MEVPGCGVPRQTVKAMTEIVFGDRHYLEPESCYQIYAQPLNVLSKIKINFKITSN